MGECEYCRKRLYQLIEEEKARHPYVEGQDYCGPTNSKLLSWLVPDGDFGRACWLHDRLYERVKRGLMTRAQADRYLAAAIARTGRWRWAKRWIVAPVYWAGVRLWGGVIV